MSNINISYSDYGNRQIIDTAEFKMSEFITVVISCDNTSKTATITMTDTQEDTSITETVDAATITTLIRMMSQIRNQIK